MNKSFLDLKLVGGVGSEFQCECVSLGALQMQATGVLGEGEKATWPLLWPQESGSLCLRVMVSLMWSLCDEACSLGRWQGADAGLKAAQTGSPSLLTAVLWSPTFSCLPWLIRLCHQTGSPG